MQMAGVKISPKEVFLLTSAVPNKSHFFSVYHHYFIIFVKYFHPYKENKVAIYPLKYIQRVMLCYYFEIHKALIIK